MPKAYVIVTEDVKDEAGMAAYMQAAGPTLAQYGGKALVFGGSAETVEGEWHGDRTVVLEFESVEAAHAWYDSPEYGKAKPLRQAAAESNAVILTGI